MAIGHWNESVMDLIPGYRHTKRMLEQTKQRADDKADKERLGSMISDCQYTLEWLETGRRPGSMRGVERPYRISTWDPSWIDAYHSPSGWSVQRESRDLTPEERDKIAWAMEDLSPREKQCFMMYHVDGMSITDIAQELHLGRSTVQTNLERAKEKIENTKVSSLFLLG